MKIDVNNLPVAAIDRAFSFALLIAMMFTVSMFASVSNAQEFAKAKLQLVDGTDLQATISGVDENGKVAGEGIPDGLMIDQLLSIQTAKSVVRTESNQTIHLADGGTLGTSNARIENDQLTFSSSVGLTSLPLESIRAIVWKSSESVDRSIASPSSNNDRVLVDVGGSITAVEGLLEKIVDEKVHLNYGGESKTISMSKVVAVVVADLKLDAPTGPPATISLTDGSTLVGAFAGLANGEVKLGFSGGTAATVPSSKVFRIDIKSNRLVFLSDLTPSDVQQRSLFTVMRGWQRDRSVTGGVLTLNSSQSEQPLQFKKGLGTQSVSTLTFRNDNAFTSFRATVGIDADTKGRGDCVLTVQGDGIELWSNRVRSEDDPQEVAVEITGMKEITLLIQAGEQFDLSDHADWCNARFTK